MSAEMYDLVANGHGFIAALDQSGGSTPKALKLYGVEESEYSNEAEMFDLIHKMRTRIATSPAFTGERILGAILFEMTLDREIEGQPSAKYLWDVKKVVPFLKIDKGLEDEVNGVQLMKPIPGLSETLAKAASQGVFGTKERSVINSANAEGIKAIVAQQFAVGEEVLAGGLVPILEPEVNIHAADKAEAEVILKEELLRGLETVSAPVMLKLSIPTVDDFYAELVDHKNVLKVVALSGGYNRDDANVKLSKNRGVIASFSRALTEGLSSKQSDEEFNALLDSAIQSIYEASK
ncbi:MAG: fructose bisphosphate aldolase [Microbacteriaceae bacterium]|nr:fructose bisphosphate aldolase [Microbacteriaceae bacterium]